MRCRISAVLESYSLLYEYSLDSLETCRMIFSRSTDANCLDDIIPTLILPWKFGFDFLEFVRTIHAENSVNRHFFSQFIVESFSYLGG